MKTSHFWALLAVAALAVVLLGRRGADGPRPPAAPAPGVSQTAPQPAPPSGALAPAASAPSPAAAPAPAVARPPLEGQSCRDNFNFPMMVGDIDARIARDLKSRVPGVDFNALRRAMIEHGACRAFATGNVGACGALMPIQQAGEPANQCLLTFDRMWMWISFNAGRLPEPLPEDCKLMAGSGTSGLEACQLMRDAWMRRGDLCKNLAPRFSAKARKVCAAEFSQITAKTFKPSAGAVDDQAFSEFVRHHLWHRTMADCEATPYVGARSEGGPYTAAVRRGACYGIFQPARCDALLAPVKLYFCGK